MYVIALTMRNTAKGAILLGILLTGLLLFYIFQVNALTSSVYFIGDQETRLRQLQEQNIFSDAQRLPSFSRTRMEELALSLQFERVQKVSYIRILSTTVATTTNQK